MGAKQVDEQTYFGSIPGKYGTLERLQPLGVVLNLSIGGLVQRCLYTSQKCVSLFSRCSAMRVIPKISPSKFSPAQLSDDRRSLSRHLQLQVLNHRAGSSVVPLARSSIATRPGEGQRYKQGRSRHWFSYRDKRTQPNTVPRYARYFGMPLEKAAVTCAAMDQTSKAPNQVRGFLSARMEFRALRLRMTKTRVTNKQAAITHAMTRRAPTQTYN